MILMHDYVIVEPITETKTKSGIYLSLESQEKQLTGIVTYVGKDIDDENLVPGKEVIFDKLNSTDAPKPFEGKIIQYEDIIAIVE